MYETVSVLQGNKRILPWNALSFFCCIFILFSIPMSLCVFSKSKKKKSMRKCLIQFVLCFWVGVVVKLYGEVDEKQEISLLWPNE